MDGATGNATWITAAAAPGAIDDLPLMREAGRLLSRELAGAVSALRVADEGTAPHADAADRLDAVRDLHALLLPPHERNAIDVGVTGLILALARTGSGDPVPVSIVVDMVVVGAPATRAILLTLSSLLCGEASGIVAGDDRIEIEVRVDEVGAEIVIRDFGDGFPDRPHLGGRTLRRAIRAAGGHCSTSASPGLSTTRVALPLAVEVRPMRIVGHA